MSNLLSKLVTSGQCTFFEETSLDVEQDEGGKAAHSLTEVRHVSYTGLGCRWVVAVSVEDLAEGERDRKMCLFKLEEPSKDPEKEVTAKRKREREWEIDLAGKISLVGRTR
jgi:hypothetical protein